MSRNASLTRWSLCMAVALWAGPTAGAEEDWDDRAVDTAIGRAREYLWSQWSEGHWQEKGTRGARGTRRGFGDQVNYGGRTALCAYALLAAGQGPQSKRMQQTLEWLAQVPMHGTYARALRANVWAMAGPQASKLLAADVKWLIDCEGGYGGYGYYPPPVKADPERPPGRWDWRIDNSNSQLAVLGVWAGARAGHPVPPSYWRRVERYWGRVQASDGGWAYRMPSSGQAAYGSMTAAGLATMFICFDALHRDEFVQCKARPDYPPIARGLAWLDGKFKAEANPGKGAQYYFYYIYSVERVGLASGYKYFGRKDWYKLITAALLKRQGRAGGWRGAATIEGSIEATSFALLFLARGRRPVLFNKLKYDGTWNPRPRDLANLTRWISRNFEKRVNWQIIHLGVPVREMHDAPILYISGSAAPNFSDADLAALRRFVGQGGTILSEAACNDTRFNLAMRKHYARLFPENEFAKLPADHPVYNLHFRIKRAKTLMGISNGIRLLVIHSPTDLSISWQLDRHETAPAAFKQAANIYFYVTDKGSLRSRGVSLWPARRKFTPTGKLKVAVVRHAGNYNPEPLAWERFALLMGNRHRVAVEVSPPTDLAELDPRKWPVATMTGTGRLKLTAAQRAGLAKYVAGGGMLVVDAAGGSQTFAAAALEQLTAALPAGKLRKLPRGHDIYTLANPMVNRFRYRRAVRLSPAQRKWARLREITVAGRTAVIFSPDDLTAGLVGYPCWRLKGYAPETAFALMRGIMTFASGRAKASGPGGSK